MTTIAPTATPLGPAHGFTSEKAQGWVLTAAIVTAVIYAFRRVIEPSVSSAPAKGSKASRVLGAGSPPAPVGQWAIAYGAAFLMLALVAEVSPETAGSLAILVTLTTLLTNGPAIVADIKSVE